ncbi:hypothetical protein Trydic_g8733, partial [Trypoxylus dichotomus]
MKTLIILVLIISAVVSPPPPPPPPMAIISHVYPPASPPPKIVRTKSPPCLQVTSTTTVYFQQIKCLLYQSTFQALKIQRCHYPPWYDTEIIYYLHIKSAMLAKDKAHKTHYYHDAASVTYRSYLDDIENSLCNDPKRFWSFVHRSRGRSRTPSPVELVDTEYSAPMDMVNASGVYFGSVYTELQNNNLLMFNDTSSCTITFSNSFTSGLNGVPGIMVK